MGSENMGKQKQVGQLQKSQEKVEELVALEAFTHIFFRNHGRWAQVTQSVSWNTPTQENPAPDSSALWEHML